MSLFSKKKEDPITKYRDICDKTLNVQLNKLGFNNISYYWKPNSEQLIYKASQFITHQLIEQAKDINVLFEEIIENIIYQLRKIFLDSVNYNQPLQIKLKFEHSPSTPAYYLTVSIAEIEQPKEVTSPDGTWSTFPVELKYETGFTYTETYPFKSDYTTGNWDKNFFYYNKDTNQWKWK